MKLIDKSALVAEIDSWRDNIIKAISDIPLRGRDRADAAFEYEILGKVKDSLDFFEVKEIDLEKEITRVSKNEYFDFTDWKSIARHFFELGLKSQK